MESKIDLTLITLFLMLISIHLGAIAHSLDSIDRAQWRQVYWAKVAARAGK